MTEWLLDTPAVGFARAESPIEELFVCALVTHIQGEGLRDRVGFTINSNFPRRGESGHFRLDVLLLTRMPAPNLNHTAVVVELDGHEFHERTQGAGRKGQELRPTVAGAGVPGTAVHWFRGLRRPTCLRAGSGRPGYRVCGSQSIVTDPTVPYEQAQELDEARSLEEQSIAVEWLEAIEESMRESE